MAKIQAIDLYKGFHAGTLLALMLLTGNFLYWEKEMNSIKKAVLAATLAITGFATSAQAALIGDDISLEGKSINLPATINQNAEFTGIAQYLKFDFSATQLIVTVSAATPNKYNFADSLGAFVFKGFNDVISKFELTRNSPQFKNFDDADYSFDAHSITLNFSGAEAHNHEARLEFSLISAPATPNVPPPVVIVPPPVTPGLPPPVVIVPVTVPPEVPAPATSVPEPTTVALLGLGLLGVAASRRKSGKSANA